MAYSRNIDDTAPPATFNNLAFTQALFQEAPDVDGTPPVEGTETTLETITLSPVDNDPANPVLRDLTTDLATLQTAWYRIVWVKASGAEFAAEWRFIDDNAQTLSVDLCTLDDVRALMQKAPAATEQDVLIQQLITRASVKIMRDYDREFVPGGPDGIASTNATRTFEYPWADQQGGEALVSLAPYDLQARSTVTVIADSDQDNPGTLTTGEFRLWPQPAAQGVFTAIKVYPLNVSFGIVGWRDRQITITGDWGFPSVPPEVTQACAETVIHWITAYPAAGRPDLGDSMIPITPRSYPMTAVDLLQPFKRMVL